MNEEATSPDTGLISVPIPVITIELVPSKNANSPIETSSEDVVNWQMNNRSYLIQFLNEYFGEGIFISLKNISDIF